MINKVGTKKYLMLNFNTIRLLSSNKQIIENSITKIMARPSHSYILSEYANGILTFDNKKNTNMIVNTLKKEANTNAFFLSNKTLFAIINDKIPINSISNIKKIKFAKTIITIGKALYEL
jgi:hypothetical protein